jgi:sodium-dependent phosphate cotransporter
MLSAHLQAWQVALCHLFFNLFGIAIWYPIPAMRQVPLNMARYLGSMTGKYTWFPLAYVGVVFFIIPGIVYGIALAATS